MRERSTIEAPEERRLEVTWLRDLAATDTSLQRRHRASIFLVSDGTILDHCALALAGSSRRSGALVVLFCPRPQIVPGLLRSLDRVIYVDAGAACTPEQTIEILHTPDRRERIVGALADRGTATVTFWCGDLQPLVVGAGWIRAKTGVGRIASDRLRIMDMGKTVAVGESRLLAEEIRCDFDAVFRREFRRRQWATDDSLGSKVRVLRRQLGLRREDFPGVDAKTVARIERNEIRRPQRETLRLMAQTLGLSHEHLGQLLGA